MATKVKFQCDIHRSFAIAFRNWRLKNNFPLKKIAKDLNLSVATISAWELGERFPTNKHFQALVNYTGVPPCRLFCVMSDRCMPAACQLAMHKPAASA